MSACLPRPVHWLAKRDLIKGPLTRWFFEGGGCIPVDRDTRSPHAFDAALDALRNDQILGICPEGRRNLGKLGPAKTGVARLALESGAPVIPAGVLTDRFWPRGQAMPNLREPIYVSIGQPTKLEGDPASPTDAQRETDRVMDAIAALLDEARAARATRADWPAP